MSDQTILERMLAGTVRFGKLIYPTESVNKSIRKATQILVVMSPDDVHQISLRGTATSIKYRHRYWLISTRHQIKEFEMEQAGVLANFPNHYVSSEGCHSLSSTVDDSDQFDLYAWEFTGLVNEGAIESGKFLGMLDSGQLRDGEKVLGGCLFGYGFSDHTVDWSEDDEHGPKMSHVHLPQREFFVEYHGDAYESSVFKVVAINKDSAELDGFSGSPVFLYVLNDEQIECKFAGLVLRGGNGNFYVVKHSVIRRLLDRKIEQDKQ